MKGTLFSADFIKDESSNLRLLELNTDTAFIANTLSSRFDFTSFNTLLSDNTITELVVIYKFFHKNFIDVLETYISENATFITTFTRQLENRDSIYPEAVEDADDKFILRLAYDENALFDSTYCKDRANVQKLFYDNSATGSIPEFYYSGSDYNVNTLTSDLNEHSILPDVVVKDKTELFKPLSFLKFGNADSSSADKLDDFVGNYLNAEQTVEKFHFEASDISADNKVSAIRVFGIVYGAEINHLILGQYKVPAFFELPTSDDLSYMNSTNFYHKFQDKHYFQLTSNYLRITAEDTVHQDEVVITSGSGELSVSDIVTGSILESMFIAGAPDSDAVDVYRAWYATGSTLPSGSFVTSSIVTSVSEGTYDNYGVSGEIILANDERIYTSVTKHLLVYSTGSDVYYFCPQHEILPTDHFLVDKDDNKISVVANNVAVLESTDDSVFYRIDVETTDSYFISSSQNQLIVHNAPCFVAGTKVHIEEKGITNIEDVEVGDKVISYNHDTDVVEYKEVLKFREQENKNIVTYIFENGTELAGTPDHPLFVVGKGYSSYYPKQTLEDSGLDVEQILLGDEVLHMDGYGVTITDIVESEKTHTVYNLEEVKDNNNFFVADLLAHNRYGGPCCFIAGTEITLANGDSKNIEDIIIGDEVIGWKDGERSNGVVSELKPTYLGNRSLYNINDLKITFTDEHPFLTKDGWKSIVPDVGTEYGLLIVGDEINYNGEWITINEFKEIEGESYNQPVYNFTVEDIHSYIADGIIVHNK
jgi:hypothetical protein